MVSVGAARFRDKSDDGRTIDRAGLTAISQGRGLVGVACPVVTLGGYGAVKATRVDARRDEEGKKDRRREGREQDGECPAGAEEPTSLCRLPARSPGCSCHGGHKPGIEHQGGHFYGRQLCLATAWPRYGS